MKEIYLPLIRPAFVITGWLALHSLAFGFANSIEDEVIVDGRRTYLKTYRSETLTPQPTLLIVLHGDSPFQKPGYQYAFARQMAEQGSNLVAVGLLRPGYTDVLDRTSDGELGDAVGDNYGTPQLDQIANVINVLKTTYQAGRVVAVGHSGGAAMTALLASHFPGLLDHAVLVSCPCNVNQWRASMLELTSKPIFKGDLAVLSPHALVDSLAKDLELTLIVGNADPVTPLALSAAYEETLKAKGRRVHLHVVEGAHDVLLSETVKNIISAILANLA